MPEILKVTPDAADIVEQVRQEPGDSLLKSWHVIKRLRETGELPETFLGSGANSLVMSDPDNPAIVHAIHYNPVPNIRKMLEIFHLNKMLCTLFPHNFPRFISAWFNTDEGFNGMVRERIYEAPQPTAPTQPFSDVQEFIRECDYIPLYYESKAIDFRVGPDGGQYYLDEVDLYDRLRKGHIKKVLQWMKNHLVIPKHDTIPRPYTVSEKSIVERTLHRLAD